MSEKLYSARRWTEIPNPIPVESDRKMTDEEKEENRKWFEDFLKKLDVLKEGDDIRDYEVRR